MRRRNIQAPRHYSLKFMHKHLPEMQKIVGLAQAPLFTPVICNVHSGLAVETFLPGQVMAEGGAGPREIQRCLSGHYAGEKFVRVMPFDKEAALDEGFFDITACNGTNRADVFVFGHDDQAAVICRLDNLGKGASGAAIQCLNLMLGVEESRGSRPGVEPPRHGYEYIPVAPDFRYVLAATAIDFPCVWPHTLRS